MANNEQEKTFQEEALEWFIKIKVGMINAFSDLNGFTDTRLAKATIGGVGNGIGVVVDYTDGLSTAEIMGKTFGTIIDFAGLKKITQMIVIKQSGA